MSRKSYRQEIIESSKKILSEKGYEFLNMRNIANGAGIKAASIYNHFKSKDEIIFQLIYDGRLILSKKNIGSSH